MTLKKSFFLFVLIFTVQKSFSNGVFWEAPKKMSVPKQIQATPPSVLAPKLNNQNEPRSGFVKELLALKESRPFNCTKKTARTRAKCMVCNCKNEVGDNRSFSSYKNVNVSVLARMESALFPNKTCDVVWQGHNTSSAQYSWTMYRKHTQPHVIEKTRVECIDAAIQAIKDYPSLEEENKWLNYHADYVFPAWARRCLTWGVKPYKDSAGHLFYSNCKSESSPRFNPLEYQEAIAKIGI